MRLSQSFWLLTGIAMAFATNMPRNPNPFVKQHRPFYAPRQDSPVHSRYIGQPCQYNSDYDPSITEYDRAAAENFGDKPFLTIKLSGNWTRRDSCIRWSVPNYCGGIPDPNDGNPVECCIDLACSTSKNGSCRQYGVIDNGCAGGEWANDVSECLTQLGLSELNVQCCIGDKYKHAGIKNGGQKASSPKGPKVFDNSTSPASTDPILPPLGQDDRAARGAFLPPEQFPNGFTTGG